MSGTAMTIVWIYRWASPTGAHNMPAPEELEYLGYERCGEDRRYGSILYRRQEP